MLNTPDDIPGFSDPGHIARFHRRRSAVFAQLVATLALIVAIAIAAVAVTMEIAEAGVLKSAHDAGGGVAFAAFLALVMVGMGGLMALVAAAPVASAERPGIGRREEEIRRAQAYQW
jgi:hypothetical protein